MTLKQDLIQSAKDFIATKPDWEYSSKGMYKYKISKNTDVSIYLGFNFKSSSCFMQPSVWVQNKKFSKLAKEILGYEGYGFPIQFQSVLPRPNLAKISICFRDQKTYDNNGNLIYWDSLSRLRDQAPEIFSGIFDEGLKIIDEYLDLSSEENLLNNLPLTRNPQFGLNGEELFTPPYMFCEGSSGPAQCLLRIVVGNFDFVEQFASGVLEGVYDKRTAELNKILAALPELKRKFAETGSVI